MFKKPSTVVLLLVIVVLLAGILVAMNKTAGPESTVEKFETALNSMDADLLLDCFQPSVAKPIRSLLNLFSSAAGIEIRDVFSMIPMLSWFDSYSEQPKFDFKILDSKVDGDTAMLTMEITTTVDGSKDVVKTIGGFIKVNGEWYIDEGNGWEEEGSGAW